MLPVRSLLACGLAASPLSLATDIVASASWRRYRPAAESISALTSVGAPTRPMVAALDLARDALLAAFGVGVWAAADGGRLLGATGALVTANAALDAIATAALPRDYSQPTWGARNTANTLVMAAGVACFTTAIGTGAAALPGRFRAFSVAIPSSYAGLTVLSLLLTRGRATPATTTGIQERTMAYSYLLWIGVLAGTLLRLRARRPATA